MENLKIRKIDVEVKGQKIIFDEYYKTDIEGNEIFDRDIEIENDKRLYDIYKKQNNLLTISEIQSIRNKYDLNQKEYAEAIGVGEITVHRFENGSIQTEAIDAIMKLSNDPSNMMFLIMQNKKNLTKELYEKILFKIEELKTLKKHALIELDKINFSKLKFNMVDVEVVAKNIIDIYNKRVDNLVQEYEVIPEYITNLKLQKLLYYVQSYSLLLFNRRAFNEKIMAWSYGPVVEKVYQEYKEKHANEITLEDENVEDISEGLRKVVEMVITTYGGIEATELIDFTHEEEPWEKTKINSEIKIDLIKDYFNKVYNI
ncbi:MAG: DUF4065 domain-containing protein [Endomicrobiaceae bacterium]|nr:DUF4065 domain-containing protein [Endomicrobiaceae bacterium]